uniref:Thioredoxin domain-containing protein n=1 Tax=Alexandrium catenella TaxID=2925 RepID=A0A7S1RHA5_ALECA
MPQLERVWLEVRKNPQCRIVAVGRGCNSDGLQCFREECRAAASEGDRHIVELSLPMAPDLDKSVFGCFAEAVVPRFYLLGPDASILYQRGGFDEQEFAAMKLCLDQELMYL